MEVVRKSSPPTKFEPYEGGKGAYAIPYDELRLLPVRTVIEIEDRRTGQVYAVSAGTWQEYGVVERHEEGMDVLLWREYFTKK